MKKVKRKGKQPTGPKPPRVLHDWGKLEAEWLESGKTLNAFRISHDIREKVFYYHVNLHKWEEKRSKLNAKILADAQKIVAKRATDRWKNYKNATDALLAQIIKILQGSMEDGVVKRPLDPKTITTLSLALKNLTSNKSFLEGGPSEVVGVQSLHGKMNDIIEVYEKTHGKIIDVESLPDD